MLALVVMLGLALAAPHLRRGLLIDEPYTANTARLSWSGMWSQLYLDSPDPLIYVLLYGWTRLAGESPLALRAPSMLFFALTICVTGQLARRLAGAWAGVLAGLLMAFSLNLAILYAAEARPYMLLGLCAAASTYLTCGLLGLPGFGPPRRLLWLAAGLAGVLLVGVLTHPIFVFYALALTLAGVWRSPRQWLWLAAAGTVAGLVYLALMAPLLRAVLPLPTTAWMRPPAKRDLLAGATSQLWSPVAAGVLAAALLYLLATQRARAAGLFRQLPPRLLMGLIAVPFAATVAISYLKPIYYAPRTPMLWLPAACVLAALLLARLDPRRRLTRLALAAMLFPPVAAAVPLLTNPQPDPALAAIRALAPELRCGDRLVAGALAYAELVYDLRQAGAPQLGTPDCLVLSTFPAETIRHSGWLRDVPNSAAAAEAGPASQALQAQPGVPVWFFYDSRRAQSTNDALKTALDQALGPPQKHPLAGLGWRFDRVYVYYSR